MCRIVVLLCLVKELVEADWVKLPEIELKDEPKTYNRDSQVVKIPIDINKNISYLDMLSELFTTNKKHKSFNNNDQTVAIRHSAEIVTARPISKAEYRPRIGQIVKVDRINSVENCEKEKNVTINEKKESFEKETKKTLDKSSGDIKKDFLNIKYFAAVITNVQKNIFSHIPKTINNKLKFLKNIRDNIMHYLDEQINKMWINKREKRSSKDDSHLDFPSSETALMSIGFLTFSVFLIKLVMQLIYVLKAKKMMSVTPLTAVGRSYSHPGNATTQNEDTIRIIRLMEEYKNK